MKRLLLIALFPFALTACEPTAKQQEKAAEFCGEDNDECTQDLADYINGQSRLKALVATVGGIAAFVALVYVWDDISMAEDEL